MGSKRRSPRGRKGGRGGEGAGGGREAAGGRVVYGINPVAELLRTRPEGVKRLLLARGRSDRTVSEILKRAGDAGIWVERLTAEEITAASGTPNHQGAAALVRGGYPYSDLDGIISGWRKSGESALILLLDSIQDPQNLGTLIRSASAAGVHGVVIPTDRASEVTPAVVKASAGATEHTLIARETNLRGAIQRLKDEGVWVAGVEADAEKTIYGLDLRGDVAIVVGSEGKGLRRLIREECDFVASIPMAGKINSLNAAQAGTVAIFEARRQRSS